MKNYTFEETEQRKADTKLFLDHPDGLEEIYQTRDLVRRFNNTPDTDMEERTRLAHQFTASFGEHSYIGSPVTVGIARYLSIGNNVYINTNCIFEDNYMITIEDRVMFGPRVTVLTSGHPVHPDMRAGGISYTAPVRIKQGAWIGACTTILPGVTIGENSVIGAGSVVTHDIPDNVIAMGVPCRVVRSFDERDKEVYFKDYTFEYGFSD